jgi:3-hydroxymyristoyl/3-hydroxydecanoyl-(acyl carrier protein) dehydratase
VDKAKLRRQVRPGDKMGLECRSVVVHVDGQLVAQGELSFAFAKIPTLL